jgi:hypothetical protein
MNTRPTRHQMSRTCKLFCLTTFAVLPLTACGGGVGSAKAFCATARSFQQDRSSFDFTLSTNDPVALKKAYELADKQSSALATFAPPAIKKDAQTLKSSIRSIKELLAKDDYDMQKFSSELVEPDAVNAFDQADSNVADYISETCGIDLGS